jgi:hypothetical protein
MQDGFRSHDLTSDDKRHFAVSKSRSYRVTRAVTEKHFLPFPKSLKLTDRAKYRPNSKTWGCNIKLIKTFNLYTAKERHATAQKTKIDDNNLNMMVSFPACDVLSGRIHLPALSSLACA